MKRNYSTLFTIQTFIEDWLNKHGLIDADGYAVRLAKMYFQRAYVMETSQFLNESKKIKTLFFTHNRIKNRFHFESELVRAINRMAT